MKPVSILDDSRINAKNVLVEMEVEQYEKLIKDALNKNEFQRKRVRSSKTVYALLREDLLRQCVIPPIVLALTNDIDVQNDDNDFSNKILENKNSLVILDGLQRTYTIFDLLSDLRSTGDERSLEKVLKSKLRIEIYIGLNRLGILYRMLTLNTGQTPMSLRQQIEMLYLDYLDNNNIGVELIRESDGKVANKEGQYNFKDIVEGFNAYINRDELPIDKANILENINSLESLSKENQANELFEDYLTSLDEFIKRICAICGDAEVSDEYAEEKGNIFGKNATQVFKKPQAFSGFGAAIGKLFDFKVIDNFEEVKEIIGQLTIREPEVFLEEINDSLLWLKNNSKKIGNAQRTFFTFFFRDIFNPESDAYRNLEFAASSALRKYQSQNM